MSSIDNIFANLDSLTEIKIDENILYGLETTQFSYHKKHNHFYFLTNFSKHFTLSFK